MSKKVVLKGIEILTNENNSSARILLDMVEIIIDHLESDLDPVDDNFQALINMDFTPDQSTRHSISFSSLSRNGTREKLMSILEKSTNSHENKIAGTVRVDLQVEDES
jgi:hypothetical protein